MPLQRGLLIIKVELFLPGVLIKTSSGKLKRRANLKLWEEKKILKRQTKSALKKSIQIFMLYSKTLQNKFNIKN